MVESMYTAIFVDSGAFSAQRSGTPIILKDYMEFIHANKDVIDIYANLDVIGSWKKSWENQRIMESEGLTPLPVHHLEDPIKCLDWCLEYKYFALGGIAGGATTKDRIRFFDKCWDIICDKDGYPKGKVHGFGMASPPLIKRYPWWSIDSQSWVAYGRYGIVIFPKLVDGRYDYFTPPVKVFVSDKSTKKGVDGLHYNTLSPKEKWGMDKYLEFHNIPFGDENTKGVSNDNFWRDLINYLFFTSMCSATKNYPWAWKRPSVQTLF